MRNAGAAARLKRWQRFVDGRRMLAFAPHDVSLYADLLQRLRAMRGMAFPSFSVKEGPESDISRMFLRHDVDTADCVKLLPALLDANLREQVGADVFIRTDGQEYDPAVLRETVRRYRDRGVEFGLHTSCYVEDDYFAELQRETERFENAFEVAPRTFTVHGLGEFRMDVRLEFSESIVPRLGEFGYEFSDCSNELRTYAYTITDCHPDPDTGQRFIHDEFRDIPNVFLPGRDYLVLTHPCYWRVTAESGSPR